MCGRPSMPRRLLSCSWRSERRLQCFAVRRRPPLCACARERNVFAAILRRRREQRDGWQHAGVGGTSGVGGAGANASGGPNAGQSACVPRAGGCDLNSDCSAGSYCVNGQSKLGSGLNEQCLPGCQAGLACIGGTCVPPTLVCASSSDCGVGVQAECDYVSNNGACISTGQISCFICVPASVGGAGGRCNSQWQCGSAGYCAPGTLGGECFARGAENGTCNPQYDSCLTGLYCAYVGTSGAVYPSLDKGSHAV